MIYAQAKMRFKEGKYKVLFQIQAHLPNQARKPLLIIRNKKENLLKCAFRCSSWTQSKNLNKYLTFVSIIVGGLEESSKKKKKKIEWRNRKLEEKSK